MINRRPRILSSVRYVLGGIAVLLVASIAVARAVPNALASRPASQAQPVYPAIPVWLIFVDDLHLDFTSTGHLRDLFKKVTNELVQQGDLFAVVSSGPSSIAIDLTRDRGEVNEALARMTGAGLKPSEIVQPASSREILHRAHLTFDTAYVVMKMLGRLPNTRKACIYISNGYSFDVHGAISQPDIENPFLAGGNIYSFERLQAEVAELARQAKRSNVTIFAIDPRALSGPPTIDPKVDDAAWQQYWTTTRKSLQVIAEPTGGRVIHDDLDGNLKQIRTAMR